MVAAKLANMPRGNPSFSNSASLPNSITQQQAADMLNVDERSVRSARKVHDAGAPELVEAVEAGKVAVTTTITTL